MYFFLVDWYYFMQLMKKEVHNFAGLYWEGDDFDQVVHLKEKMPEYSYINAMGTSMMERAYKEFKSWSMVPMNLYPERYKKFFDYMNQNKVDEANAVKEKLIQTLDALIGNKNCVDAIKLMKAEFDKLNSFKLGPVCPSFKCTQNEF